MQDVSEIKKKIHKELDYLKREFKVKEIGIFDSYVRGDAEEE